MVVKKVLEEYCQKAIRNLSITSIYIEFKKEVEKRQLNTKVKIKTIEDRKDIYCFLSINVVDDSGMIFMIPPGSDFYDKIGTLGGNECILKYHKKTGELTKYEISDELLDDINVSVAFLKQSGDLEESCQNN